MSKRKWNINCKYRELRTEWCASSQWYLHILPCNTVHSLIIQIPFLSTKLLAKIKTRKFSLIYPERMMTLGIMQILQVGIAIRATSTQISHMIPLYCTANLTQAVNILIMLTWITKWPNKSLTVQTGHLGLRVTCTCIKMAALWVAPDTVCSQMWTAIQNYRSKEHSFKKY